MSAMTPVTEMAATNSARNPSESDEYRKARQELLVEEIELRRHVESVAEQRRQLPPGGEVPDDYSFVAEDGSEVRMSELFGDHETLVVYSYMFGPQREAPCPMCTSLMGGFDHKIDDIRQRVSIAFTARSPIERLIEAKRARGWTDLPVYSDVSGDYTRAYVSADDEDMPAYNVFTRHDGTIRHFWSDEISMDMSDPGQDPRGAVEMDPLWLLLDTVPAGRGTDWYPSLTYPIVGTSDREVEQGMLDEEAATIDPRSPDAPEQIAELIHEAEELGLDPTQPVPDVNDLNPV